MRDDKLQVHINCPPPLPLLLSRHQLNHPYDKLPINPQQRATSLLWQPFVKGKGLSINRILTLTSPCFIGLMSPLATAILNIVSVAWNTEKKTTNNVTQLADNVKKSLLFFVSWFWWMLQLCYKGRVLSRFRQGLRLKLMEILCSNPAQPHTDNRQVTCALAPGP